MYNGKMAIFARAKLSISRRTSHPLIKGYSEGYLERTWRTPLVAMRLSHPLNGTVENRVTQPRFAMSLTALAGALPTFEAMLNVRDLMSRIRN